MLRIKEIRYFKFRELLEQFRCKLIKAA